MKTKLSILPGAVFLYIFASSAWPGLIEATQTGDPVPVRESVLASILVQLVILALVIALNELLAPKPNIQDALPAGLGDFDFPTATEGRAVPLLWGRVLIKGPNVVWYGDLAQQAITTNVQISLFQSTRVVKGYRYFVGMQYAICRGPIDEVNSIIIAETEVFSGSTLSDIDVSNLFLFGGEENGQGGIVARFEVYPGSTTQTASPYLSLFQGITQQNTDVVTLPYKGTCYFVFRSLLTDGTTVGGGYIGTSQRLEPIAFEVSRYPVLIPGQTTGDNRIGNGANPANVLYEFLRNDEWGLNVAESRIDVASFLAASDVLIDEGNGFSFTLQSPVQRDELKTIIEDQIDGLCRVSRRTGLWELRLARADYVIEDLPVINDDNLIAVAAYEQPTWLNTTNNIVAEFFESGDQYKQTYAVAQDSANQQIQGRVVTAEIKLPGVKTRALAANLAWRELRLRSRPLARATLEVTQEFFETQPLDVVLFTSSVVGADELPMRVSSVDLGKIDAGAVRLQLIEDVFAFRAASGGNPPVSLWPDPEAELLPFASDRQVAMEAPRGIRARDPYDPDVALTLNALLAKVFAWGRRAAQETAYDMRTRSDPTMAPTGAFATVETSAGFALLGTTKTTLARGTGIPTTSITIEAGPDSQAALVSSLAFETGAGLTLRNLVYIGNSTVGEYAIVESATAGSGIDVVLNNVYRGVLDTPQRTHAAGTNVFVVSVGAAISNEYYATTGQIDVKLIPTGYRSQVLEGDATTISITPNARQLRPTPVSKIFAETVLYNATPSLEAQGSTIQDRGFNVEWERRAYDVADEIAAFDADSTGVSAQSQQQRVWVRNTAGTVEVQVQAYSAGVGPVKLLRVDYLRAVGGTAGTAAVIRVRTQHVPTGYSVALESTFDAEYDVTPTSALTTQFALGVMTASAGAISASYAAASAGTFVVNLGAAIGSNFQASINGGSFSTVVSAGNTTGNIAGIAVSDTIRFQVAASTAAVNVFVELVDPSATSVAYGVIAS